LASIVTEAAAEGDATAQKTIRQGAEDLAACVTAVAHRLKLNGSAFEVVQVGGLLRAGEVVTAPLREAIQSRLPNAVIRQPELPPVLGAGLLALRQLGLDTSAETISVNLHKASTKLT
jgi:N-acetylglucosamine kinase-like BadF-type ATPase